MKPHGGYRPIGLFCPLHRSPGRRRRAYAQQWEARFARPHFAGQAFSGVMDAVWRHTAKSEAANSRGG
eukprot:2664265-Pyramimonas_sp.AAC.1